jgi:hypothetical protein
LWEIVRFSMGPKSHQETRSPASANFRKNPLPPQERKAKQFHYLQENLRGSTKSRTGKERKQTKPLRKEWLSKKARGRSRCAKRRRELPFPLTDLLGHHAVATDVRERGQLIKVERSKAMSAVGHERTFHTLIRHVHFSAGTRPRDALG